MYKILGLEDSSAVRVFLEQEALKRGYVYLGVPGWADFSRLFVKNKDADAIVCDVNLDAFSGPDAVKILSKYYGADLPPVFLFSTKPADQLELLVAECSAAGYARKPDVESLFKKIDSAVAKRRRISSS